MFSKLIYSVRDHISYITVLSTTLVGIATLVLDGGRYKKKGFVRELKIVRIISYSYIVLGGIMFVILMMI